MKLYRIIAKRTSYEELYLEAENESEAIALITMGSEEYDWDDLPELDWQIESVEYQTEVKYSSEELTE
jgi:hypothetical protein